MRKEELKSNLEFIYLVAAGHMRDIGVSRAIQEKTRLTVEELFALIEFTKNGSEGGYPGERLPWPYLLEELIPRLPLPGFSTQMLYRRLGASSKNDKSGVRQALYRFVLQKRLIRRIRPGWYQALSHEEKVERLERFRLDGL